MGEDFEFALSEIRKINNILKCEMHTPKRFSVEDPIPPGTREVRRSRQSY